jgi:Ubiquitin-like modifier-activating enzyme ATG7 N-terminus
MNHTSGSQIQTFRCFAYHEVCYRGPFGSVSILGTLKNYNTIEEFKAADKTSLFNEEAQAAR